MALLRDILPQILQVTVRVPERILVLDVRPGIRAELQPLQINLEVLDSGLMPCLLPILKMSLAAELTDSSSLLSGAFRIEERWSIALEALAFLFESVLLTRLGILTTQFQKRRLD